MNKRYIVGIVITVLVLTINQFFIQYWLKQKEDDARIINVAGKQRMLSQRIVNEFHAVEEAIKTKDFLEELVNEWSTTHELLKSKFTDLDSEASAKINHELTGLDNYFNFIKEQLLLVHNNNLNLNSVAENQNAFLMEMDAVVKLLEEDADKKLNFIVWIEYLLFVIALLILVLEVYFIYRPIERTLRKSSLILKDKNEKLNLAVEKVKAKNKELSEVTYIASHDLQEPLRTVSSMVDMFNTKYESHLDEQGKTMLGFLDASASRMRNLVKDLLEYSVLGQNKTLSKVNCNQILEEVTKDLQDTITKSNAIITWDNLPIIKAYKSELRLLFQNLIVNGIKFQLSENQPLIVIQSEELEHHWKFRVSDNGIGIKEAHQEKIFSIFKRGHSSDDYEGTGIGLSHCKKIVEMHDGKLWVNSVEGEGSDFYFTIKKEIVNLQ